MIEMILKIGYEKMNFLINDIGIIGYLNVKR